MNERTINPDLLPILTETGGWHGTRPADADRCGRRSSLPKSQPAFPLTDEQCQQLAEQLFPQLEATLRDAIGSRSEARWEKAMQQVRAALPDLVRDTVQNPR